MNDLELEDPGPDPEVVRRLLGTPGRWAVVGLSQNTARAAYGVAAYLQRLGHTIVPVHPRAESVLGEPGYPDLESVPGELDVVDLFVRSEIVGALIDESIGVGAPAVWLQLDVHDAAAERRAREAGLVVVTDTCPRIEGPRLGIEPRR